jgi:hypothetical protein
MLLVTAIAAQTLRGSQVQSCVPIAVLAIDLCTALNKHCNNRFMARCSSGHQHGPPGEILRIPRCIDMPILFFTQPRKNPCPVAQRGCIPNLHGKNCYSRRWCRRPWRRDVCRSSWDLTFGFAAASLLLASLLGHAFAVTHRSVRCRNDARVRFVCVCPTANPLLSLCPCDTRV